MDPESIQALAENAAHKELEKEDVKLDGKIDLLIASVNRIETQTTKTNGRVTELEKDHVRPLENWKIALVAGGSVLLFLIMYFAWLIQSFLMKVSNLDTSINDAIDKKIPHIAEEVVNQLEEKYNVNIR